MDFFLLQFIKSVALVPVTLLPIINPLSTAPVFVAMVGADRQLAARLARQVAINSWFVIVGAMLIGNYVLAIFGISLAVVRIGGGLLVASTAWRLLHQSTEDEVHARAAQATYELSHAEVVRRSFFPITFPLTTGPGTIATCIALGAQVSATPATYILGVLIAVSGAAIVSAILFLIFSHASRVMNWLGEVGMLVVARLMAFILLCIAIQIIWDGWSELNR